MLCCVVDLEPCLLSCPGSSVGRALCLESRVSWVRVPPRAALFPLKKVLSWLMLLCLLCTCLAPLDSYIHLALNFDLHDLPWYQLSEPLFLCAFAVLSWDFYGEGNGSVYLSSNCSGGEDRLQDCPFSPFPPSCHHSSDVGLTCQPCEITVVLL